VDRRQRDALRAQQDDFLDRQNEFGRGQPDKVGGVAKRRPARPNGNAREAILRRLRRDYHQLHQLVLDGTISPHRAAITAGFRKAPGRQPKLQLPVNRTEITATQEMQMWLGCADHQPSAFASEDERRRLWFENRDRLMKWWGCHGRRPLAWWTYEAPADLYYDFQTERSTLFMANLLAEDERAELLVYWRREFARMLDPTFGDMEACRVHRESCDLPSSLLAQWSTEYLEKEEPHSAIAEGPS
jgi:hypothetical protein